jgi:hypothetical protein
MALQNVAFTDIFDTNRIRTNQIVVLLNNLTDGAQNLNNIVSITANNAYVGGINIGQTLGYINTIYNEANTSLTIANLAFDKANAANVLAFTANNNANLALYLPGAAFDKANAANVLAFTASANATLAFNKANAANVLAFTANNLASNAYSLGNGAYIAANTALTEIAFEIVRAETAEQRFQTYAITNVQPADSPYTLQLSDRGNLIICEGAGTDINIAIPIGVFSKGDYFKIFARLSSNVNIIRLSTANLYMTSDATHTNQDRKIGTYGMAEIIKVESLIDTFLISNLGLVS